MVPGGIESRLDKGELKALLAHELAHLVRGDAWWLLIGRLLCGCLPFQPLNFLARRCWRRAVEFQCDDWAADCTKNPLILARCLTRVAEWRLNDTNLAHALPARGSHSTLSCRVERLLAGRSTTDPWRRSRQRRLLTVLTMTVATLLCWIGPRTTLLAHIDDRIGNSDAIDNLDSVSVDEIQLLNAELRQLETRLRKVAQLLSNSNAPPEMRTLAAGLVSRMTDLRRHRRELLARVHLQSERPPTPGTTNSTSTNPVAINDTERPKLDSTLSVIARD